MNSVDQRKILMVLWFTDMPWTMHRDLHIPESVTLQKWALRKAER